MARPTLVLDASVGVKWFSQTDEENVPQALSIRDRHVAGVIRIAVPDLFFYEIANALTGKILISSETVLSSIRAIFALDIEVAPAAAAILTNAAIMARQSHITIYDACYAALAKQLQCPLVTANPRHQKQSLGCEVIPIEKWRGGSP